MKYVRSLKIISLVILFSFISFSAYAFLPGVDQAIPQQVYSVPMGMEVEKMAKTVQQLNYLYENVQNLNTIIEGDKSNSALLNVLMGTEDLMNVVSNNNIHKMSEEELNNYIINDMNSLFDGAINLFQRTSTKLNDIENSVVFKKTNDNFIKNSPEIQNLKSNILNENIPEDEMEENKSYEESQKDIAEYYNEKIKYISGVRKVYDSDEEGSVNNYVNDQNNNIQSSLDVINSKGSKMTMQTAINTNSKLIIDLHQTQLEILNALSTLNKQLADMNELYMKNAMEDEIKEDQRQHNRR